MGQPVIDVVHWNGQHFCVLAEGYLFQYWPDFNWETEQMTASLTKVLTDAGRPVELALVPTELMVAAHTAVMDTWSDWDKRHGQKLIRQPAQLIFARPEFQPADQPETPEQVMQWVVEERRHIPKKP